MTDASNARATPAAQPVADIPQRNIPGAAILKSEVTAEPEASTALATQMQLTSEAIQEPVIAEKPMGNEEAEKTERSRAQDTVKNPLEFPKQAAKSAQPHATQRPNPVKRDEVAGGPASSRERPSSRPVVAEGMVMPPRPAANADAGLLPPLAWLSPWGAQGADSFFAFPRAMMELSGDAMRRMLELQAGMQHALTNAMFSALSMSTAMDTNEREYVFTTSLPGFAPEEVEVRVENGKAHITARKSEEAQGAAHRNATVERMFTLPEDAGFQQAQVHLRGGILTLTVPRGGAGASGKPRTLPVKAA